MISQENQKRATKSLIINIFMEKRQMMRSDLLKKIWAHYTRPEEIDEIMTEFESVGIIRSARRNNQVLYTMEEQHIKELKSLFEKQDLDSKLIH